MHNRYSMYMYVHAQYNTPLNHIFATPFPLLKPPTSPPLPYCELGRLYVGPVTYYTVVPR